MRSRLIAPALALVAGVGLALPGSPATAAASRAPLPTHVNDCWSTDTLPPVIDSFESTPATVDTTTGPATVHLTVAAHDVAAVGQASGVGRVRVYLDVANPPTGPLLGSSLQRELTRGSDGLWHGRVTLPAGTNASYQASVVAWDKSSQGTRSVQGTAGTSRGFPGFEATSTTGPSTDTVVPSLNDLTLSSTHVDSRSHARSVTVTATATDDDSGVREVTVGLNPLSDWLPDRSTTLERVGQTDQYRGQLTFQRWTGKHRELLSVIVVDNSGNAHRLLYRKLAARALPSQISVVSGPVDKKGPHLVAVRRAARKVDVHQHGRWYAVRVVMADPQGVSSVQAVLSDLSLKTAHLHRVSGTRQRGVWAGRIRVPRCLASPASTHLRVGAVDGHDITSGTSARGVRILSADHVAPSTKHVFWRLHEPVFRFTEPVHGISAANVQVYDDDVASGPTPLTGSWSCRSATRKQVSCRKGSVLEATFTPDEPGVVPGIVVWEARAQLAVLDAHGNPFTGSSESPDVSD